MFRWIRDYLTGWAEVSVDPACRSAAAALLWQWEISPLKEENEGETLYFRLPWRQYRIFARKAVSAGLSFTERRRGGLPVAAAFCRQRPGILFGLILLIVWCLYSQCLVWQIRIDGCEYLQDADVIQILTEAGCGVGDFYPAIDFDELHARIKAENPQIAWLSVYMHGTTAEVQLRETKSPEAHFRPADTFANIVASEAGEIVSVHVFEGEACVQPGDVVLPGEMLISGVVSMKNEGESRYEYAAGEVYARVAVPISVEVGCAGTEKCYTGRTIVRKSINFFKKSINLFINTGIPYATYDTIDKMEVVCLPDGTPLPVVINTTEFREYAETEIDRTPEQAASEALDTLRKKTEDVIAAGQLLSRSITTEIAEDGTYRIECLLYILRDIAATKEFTVRDAGN